MKINSDLKNRIKGFFKLGRRSRAKVKKQPRELGYRITKSLIIFSVLILALLWGMQFVFLEKYYEYSMQIRCKNAAKAVGSYYSGTSEIQYDDFTQFLGDISSDNDVYFMIESLDGGTFLSTTDIQKGRIYAQARYLIDDARIALSTGGSDSISLMRGGGKGADKTFVYATRVDSKLRNPIYIYAVVSLTPLGPAIKIIRSQLLIVTVVVLILSILVARYISRRLSEPIADMELKARQLAKGNYDIHFEGGEFKELTNLAGTLNRAAADLKASDALQKDLMANVSHDLRTPLTMIKSYAEMIRDISGDNPEKREEHLGVIIEETDRLDDLVDDILTLSKMQAGVMEMEKEIFDIQEAAKSVYSTYLVMEQEGYSFSFNEAPGPINVSADRRRLQQVIANLMSNAVRYSKDVKEISLSFAVDNGRVICSVSDKGIGIDEEDQKNIWNRYQRASKQGVRSHTGTGLGLSIASEILEKHGAAYGVNSKPGKGSTFWFSLPVVRLIEQK